MIIAEIAHFIIAVTPIAEVLYLIDAFSDDRIVYRNNWICVIYLLLNSSRFGT